jgi:hypothetical protein
MSLESATYINQLVPTNPVASDPLSTADDHLRLIKAALKATFPNITGPMELSQDDLNGLPDSTTAALDTLETSLTAAIAAAVSASEAATKQALYPVGSIYVNATVDTNPASLLGFGTWVAFGDGRVLVGQNTSDTVFDTLGETGGSKDAIVVSHTHTATDLGHSHGIPSHNGWANGDNLDGTADGGYRNDKTSRTGYANISVSTTGSSGTNANLQPYVVVKMWKRTA